MIVFFDTSAMIKRYLTETNSDAVSELWGNASLIAASQLLYAEMIAIRAQASRRAEKHARPRPNAGSLSRRLPGHDTHRHQR